jgi:hypothetical protein
MNQQPELPPALSPSPYPLSNRARLELRCADCGYGAIAGSPPERCPMCGGPAWECDAWRPFSRLVDDLSPARKSSKDPF